MDENAKKSLLVVPGELIEDKGMKSGYGTYEKDGKIYSTSAGFVKYNRNANYVNVVPFKGRYMPREGDKVIGNITDIGPTNWMVDIGGPYDAPLHINEVPWRVEFGDTGSYLEVGETLLAMVNQVDETKRVNLTLKRPGLRRLEEGRIIHVSHTKVPRIIGRNGEMISLLKEKGGCNIFVGQNGMIWIQGDIIKIRNVVKVIERIEKSKKAKKLLDDVREMFDNEDFW